MKLTTDRPFADPEKAARKLLEIANETEAVQDGRIHIEKINGPFLGATASPSQWHRQGQHHIRRGSHRREIQAGADMFA